MFTNLNDCRDSIIVGIWPGSCGGSWFGILVREMAGWVWCEVSHVNTYYYNRDEQNGQELPPCPLCITQPATALPSSATSQSCYANSLCLYRYVEEDTEYKHLANNHTMKHRTLLLWNMYYIQRPREWLCAARSCMRLSSRLCASCQIVIFSVSQQASTQAAEMLQLFFKKVDMVGGSTSGGSSASIDDGCVRRMSSFNLEARPMNCCTWPKESSGCWLVRSTISCSLREDIARCVQVYRHSIDVLSMLGLIRTDQEGPGGHGRRDWLGISNTQMSSAMLPTTDSAWV